MRARLAATIDESPSLRAGMMQRDRARVVQLAARDGRAHRAPRSRRRSASCSSRWRASAIDRLGEHVAATIHLNPDDSRGRRRAAARRRDSAGRSSSSPIRTSRRGGCLVQSAFGTIDAGIDAQVRELSRALLGDDARRRRLARWRRRRRAEPALLARRRTSRAVAAIETAPVIGQVVRVVGLLVESTGPAASVGEICEVRTGRGPRAAGRSRRLPRRPPAVRAARRHRRHPARAIASSRAAAR